jgi:hypothetical protein
MKYILFATMISLLSMNSFALGQHSASDIDCCRTGKCGNGLPQCPLKRDGLKREAGSLKKPASKSQKATASGQ